MLFRETVTVYCENPTEHTYTVRGQNAKNYYVNASADATVFDRHGKVVFLFMKCRTVVATR
jgi:hypothetical protein